MDIHDIKWHTMFRINLEYMNFLGKNYQALVMLTIVLGGTIILTSIMGVVSIYHNKKSMINSFHLVMIFLILAQGVLFIQGIFHVTSYEVKPIHWSLGPCSSKMSFNFTKGWLGAKAMVHSGKHRMGRVAGVFQMLWCP